MNMIVEDKYFNWNEDFMTGNEMIDKEHYMLVEFINELLQASLNFENVNLDNISSLKDKLADYVNVHFTHEESLMKSKSIDTQFVEEHIVLHKEFIKKVDYFFSDVNNYNDEQKLGNVAEYLIRWLAYHILNTDKSLVRQLENIEIKGLSPEKAYNLEQQMVESSTEPLLKALRVLYRLVTSKNKEIEKKNEELEERVIERTKELQEANHKLKEMSIHDELTGLPNRRFVMDEIEKHIYEWKRYKVPFTLLFIDLDKFKVVNDIYGHKSGDRVLIWLGEYLKSHIRLNDIACRLGGDEFVIVCAHTNEEEGLAIANKINQISELKPLEGIETWQPSVSIGISTISDEIATSSMILQQADKAMYIAKSNGGGSVNTQEYK